MVLLPPKSEAEPGLCHQDTKDNQFQVSWIEPCELSSHCRTKASKELSTFTQC